VVIYAAVDGLIWPPRWLSALGNFVGALVGLPGAQDGEWVRAAGWQLVLPILLALVVMDQGSRLLGGDEASQEMELLLAYPITRRRLLLEKFGVLVVSTAVLALLVWAVAGIGFLAADGGTPPPGALPGLFLEALVFGCLAFALAARADHDRRSAWTLTLVVRGVAVLVGLLGHLLPQPLAFLSYLSPLSEISAGRRGYAMLLVGVCAVLLGMALVFFDRREVG
jgi:ABC-2 type transport system permease protein